MDVTKPTVNFNYTSNWIRAKGYARHLLRANRANSLGLVPVIDTINVKRHYEHLKAAMGPCYADVVAFSSYFDNERLHIANLAMRLTEQGWELLDHRLSIPDFLPSDYHLFLSLKPFLRKL
ncbi:hypothetical protein KIN20_010415 [Parelaphostrongylus tenuis]|uniref:Uncharacterized protein n=1 Tax=Parelaphostrongylus tenuis TaxID=148309 RepID=A0AAD5MU24_PARTN|nr:hypothetical protein KIN20_010415 [Parelaphostrongylus tenuis]